MGETGARGERELLDRIGDFEILERLGAGVMGEVWRAVDRKLGRPVAIKLLLPHKRGTRAQDRMIREARALARLVHPNVVAIYEVGRIPVDGPGVEPIYIVLEFVDGETIADWNEARRASAPGRAMGDWRAVLRMFRDAGEGLAAAHRVGLIHRDFKPANLLIERATGRVKVADFGLAFLGDGAVSASASSGDGSRDGLGYGSGDGESFDSGVDSSLDLEPGSLRLTRAGAVVGTPAYMAPEQILSRAVTAASDQFAFCLCLWEALHGSLPWHYESMDSLRRAAARGLLRPGASVVTVPRWLDRAVRRGLSERVEDRFPSMEALLSELDEGPRRPRRRALAAGLGAALIAVAGLSSWWTAGRSERGPETPDLAACEDARARLDARWNEARSEAVEAAFVVAGGPEARHQGESVTRFVDARTRVWAQEYAGLCEQAALRPLSPTEQRIYACLDLRSAELDATVGVLLSPSESLDVDGFELVHDTLALGPCTDSSFLPVLPADPAERREFLELRTRVAQLEVLRGKVSEDQLAELRVEILRFDHPPLTAAFDMVEARHHEARGDEAAHERALIRAYEGASIGSHEPLALRALGGILNLLAKQRRFAEAAWVLRQGEILDARCGATNPKESGDWGNRRGSLAFYRGDYEAAAEAFRGVWERFSSTPEGEALGLGPLSNYATATRRLGRRDEARALYLDVIGLEREIYGPQNHRLFAPYVGLALLELEVDTEASREWLERADAIAQMGIASQRALVQSNLAELELGRGAYAEALDVALGATAAFAGIDKRGELSWVSAELLVADASLALGDVEGAARRLASTRAEAEALYEGELPQGETFALLEVAIALERGELEAAEEAMIRDAPLRDAGPGVGVSEDGRFELYAGELARRRGQLAEAEAYARSGLALGGPFTVNANLVRPRLELLLAEVLWARADGQPGVNAAESMRWANSARDQLRAAASTAGRAQLLAEVEAWLAEREGD
ncbi:serine/threonine kinase family protein [Plesiocystis pacifica SIR-1]|uniref:Serine/threonine kinase family protein n=1 Tax=Plesiocystis pacifica SIR-1 TaxID=391625 RepID=A6FXI1_9BACT|nr:serine/threonine-protein kinase [Plesiocystis pacifica]EDM81569.1 serine/threonine kinase family protein [Plesiocystis pacifica SIR-1]